MNVGLISFGVQAVLTFPINRFFSTADINNALDTMVTFAGQNRNIAQGLKMVDSLFTPPNGDRDGVPNVGIAIAFGPSDVIPFDLGRAALKLRQRGNVVMDYH